MSILPHGKDCEGDETEEAVGVLLGHDTSPRDHTDISQPRRADLFVPFLLEADLDNSTK